MSRSFTIDAIYRSGSKLRYNGGRYMSTTPASAARKAFSMTCRSLNVTGKVILEIHIRETTQNSAHKTFKYRASRVKTSTEASWLDDVVFKHTTRLKSLR